MRRISLLFVTIYVLLPTLAEAIDAETQQALTLRMCDRVIAEYSDALVFKERSTDFKTLEREFARCKELVDDYWLNSE